MSAKLTDLPKSRHVPGLEPGAVDFFVSVHRVASRLVALRADPVPPVPLGELFDLLPSVGPQLRPRFPWPELERQHSPLWYLKIWFANSIRKNVIIYKRASHTKRAVGGSGRAPIVSF